MTTRVWDYRQEYDAERDDILGAVDAVFRSGRLILGESVRGFEDEFAAYHDLPHAVSCDNGTNALVLALRALGVGPGDEVVTVSNTAAPTVVAIDQVGAIPVLVDVDPSTYLMDVGKVREVITQRTRCLLPVHLYGQCVDMGPLREIADSHGVAVLEDCAQAHGARHHDRVAGSMGDVAGFSFYPTKVLGAYGDGGAILTADAEVAARLRRSRYYGMDDRYYVVATPGHNSRLDEVQAEILRRKLRRLDRYIACRRSVAQRYADGLADTGLVLPEVAPGNEHVYYLYVVRHPARDEILSMLGDQGIELTVSYRWPVHSMSGFAGRTRGGELPVTEELAGQIFSLPMYPSLPRDVQDATIDAVRRVLEAL
jgi:dTDP-3-amino-2,3,6-trideoxy-4-keto-D-glucose/dTDP-3-amino-3,4,6-trideoxy-alpha-D-glucose/dTDP-2,6-dideoxy-D-kanosamine transaminase